MVQLSEPESPSEYMPGQSGYRRTYSKDGRAALTMVVVFHMPRIPNIGMHWALHAASAFTWNCFVAGIANVHLHSCRF